MRGRSLLPAALLAAIAVGALATAPAARPATPRLRAPTRASIGSTVTVHATGLRSGRYALSLVSASHPQHGVSCLARLGASAPTVAGAVTLRGTIPAKIVCYQGLSTRLGAVPTTAGRYELTVAVPIAPAGFDGSLSFVRSPVQIKR